jgi:hypothetical protein
MTSLIGILQQDFDIARQILAQETERIDPFIVNISSGSNRAIGMFKALYI